MRLDNPGTELGVGIIGCGWVAPAYASDIHSYPELDLRGVFDLDTDRAEVFASKFGCSAFRSALPEPLPHSFELFLDALAGARDVPSVTVREAATRVAIMEALYESANRSRWITPPLE
ncbi:MAG TPA: Gfo/Idh/MocA family oxidoreductase [Actinomycetota bacterium]|nr:Gfo/Idh/MocA family oxidoreductase [Actinomycetota bacterium]